MVIKASKTDGGIPNSKQEDEAINPKPLKIHSSGFRSINDSRDVEMVSQPEEKKIEKLADGEKNIAEPPEIKKESEIQAEDGELMRLRKTVEEAQERYETKNLEVLDSLSKIEKILGKNFNSESLALRETQLYFDQYGEELEKLLDYQAEKLKDNGDKDISENSRRIDKLAEHYNQEKQKRERGISTKAPVSPETLPTQPQEFKKRKIVISPPKTRDSEETERPLSKVSSKVADKISQEVVHNKLEEKVVLVISEGSSFKDTIIKYLTEQGIEKAKAKEMAHQMWDEFAENYADPATRDYELIQAGAKIEIGVKANGGYEVIGFQDGPPDSDWIGDPEINKEEKSRVASVSEKETDIPEEKNASKVPAENVEKSPFSPDDTEQTADEPDVTEEDSPKRPQKKKEKVVEFFKAKKKIEGVKKGTGKEKRIKNKTREKADGKVLKFPDVKKRMEKNREKEFQKLAKKYEFEKTDDFDARATKIIKAVSLESLENWRMMKEVKFSDLRKELSPKLNRNINSLEKSFIILSGEAAKLDEDENETLKKWVARVTKLSIEKGEEKMAA